MSAQTKRALDNIVALAGAVRHVASFEGEHKYGQPRGTIITKDMVKRVQELAGKAKPGADRVAAGTAPQARQPNPAPVRKFDSPFFKKAQNLGVSKPGAPAAQAAPPKAPVPAPKAVSAPPAPASKPVLKAPSAPAHTPDTGRTLEELEGGPAPKVEQSVPKAPELPRTEPKKVETKSVSSGKSVSHIVTELPADAPPGAKIVRGLLRIPSKLRKRQGVINDKGEYVPNTPQATDAPDHKVPTGARVDAPQLSSLPQGALVGAPGSEDVFTKVDNDRWKDQEGNYVDRKTLGKLADKGLLAHRLSDAEYKAKQTDIENRVQAALDAGKDTQSQFEIAPQKWAPEREILHDKIIGDLWAKAQSVPNEHKILMTGGLGGAGKSSILGKLQESGQVDPSKFVTINADDMKTEMIKLGMAPKIEGLSPAETAGLIHEESSYLAKKLAGMALDEGKNIIFDVTIGESQEKRGDNLTKINRYKDKGYSITAVFVDIPVDKSIQRANERHRRGMEDRRAGVGPGGRYVANTVIEANRLTPKELNDKNKDFLSRNRDTFEKLKPEFDGWQIWDNGEDGFDAALAEESSTDGLRNALTSATIEAKAPESAKLAAGVAGTAQEQVAAKRAIDVKGGN